MLVVLVVPLFGLAFIVAAMKSSGSNQHISTEHLRDRLKIGMNSLESKRALGLGPDSGRTVPSEGGKSSIQISKVGFTSLFWPQREIFLRFDQHKLTGAKVNTVFILNELNFDVKLARKPGAKRN